MYAIKRFFMIALISISCAGVSMAQDAVFSAGATQNVEIQPVNSTEKTETVNAVNNQVQGQSLSNEKFKSAVNNLESAQVDVREQLASYKTLVENKELEVANQKAELSKLKKEYKALQNKMNNIEKMKKMLNENID